VLSAPFTSRWIFEVEMIARLASVQRARGQRDHAAMIYELPLLEWTDVKGSKVRGGDFVRAATELFAIWRRHADDLRPDHHRRLPRPSAQPVLLRDPRVDTDLS
jgi:hypothetical protein